MSASKTFAKYVRDLLGLTTAQVEIGRENFERTNFDNVLVVVDELGSTPLGFTGKFDGELEQEHGSVVMSINFTLDFIGANARENAVAFMLKNKTEEGYTLRRDLKIGVFTPSSFTDLKKLTGTQYSADYQLEVKVRYNETLTVPRLRIDTAETTIISNT